MRKAQVINMKKEKKTRECRFQAGWTLEEDIAGGFFNLLVIILILPFVMSMTCTHTPPVSPTSDAAVAVPDAKPPTPIDGAVAPFAQTCGIQTVLIDDVSNATFIALGDAVNYQSKLNTLANQYTRPSIVCLVNKIVAGTPNAPATVQRANQWLGASAKK